MSNNKNNKVLSILILFITFFIIIFFTKNAFYEMNEKQDQLKTNIDKRDKVVSDLKRIEEIEKKIENKDKDFENIKHFISSVNQEDLIEYLHDYSEDISNSGNELFINGISFGKPIKGDIGFIEQTITIKASVSNKNVLKAFLTKLTSKKSKYKFYITDFSFPNDSRSSSYTVTIPLKLLYK